MTPQTKETRAKYITECQRKTTTELILLLEIAEETENDQCWKCIASALRDKPIKEKRDYLKATLDTLNAHLRMGNIERAEILKTRMYTVYDYL